MQISTTSDLLAFTRRNRTTAQIRDRLQTVSQEAVTGLKADINQATGGENGRAHLLQKAQSDIEQANSINALSQSRLDGISRSVSGARTVIDDLDTRAFVSLQLGQETAIDAIASEAESTLGIVMNALSTRVGDRNVFSGDETNQPTFASADTLLNDVRNIIALAPTVADAETALDDYFNTPGGGFDTNIYQGGDGNPPALPLGNGTTVRLDVTGNNQEIKDTLRGLAVIAISKDALVGDDAGFQQIFENATTTLGKGKTGLLSLETELGVHASTIEKVNQRNANEALGLATAFQNLFGRDQFEAAAELQQLQTQLEASYTITSRLSNLTLTNFLR